MKSRIRLLLTLAVMILSSPVVVFSAAQMTIDTLTEKQEVIDVNGDKQTRFVQTENAAPGEILRFTLQFRNTGDTVAEDVVLDNPIPPNSSYQADSATSFKDSRPLFSTDNGSTFSLPATLTYEIRNPDGSNKTIIAPPEKYTDIRWQLPPLPAGATGQVSFNVLIQ